MFVAIQNRSIISENYYSLAIKSINITMIEVLFTAKVTLNIAILIERFSLQ